MFVLQFDEKFFAESRVFIEDASFLRFRYLISGSDNVVFFVFHFIYNNAVHLVICEGWHFITLLTWLYVRVGIL
jgi:hypothetical protein